MTNRTPHKTVLPCNRWTYFDQESKSAQMLRWYSEKTIRSTLHGYHSNLGKLNNSDPLQKQKFMQSSCKIPTCSTWSKSRMELVRKKSSEKRSRVQSQIQPIHPGPQDVWDQYSKLLLESYQGPRTTFSSGINLPRTKDHFYFMNTWNTSN